ncbi:MobF family relaxase [Actinomadura nitritigenes]|uniref:MobF family relaxase n=1 Tax=Actinomadura nitritigenes TaxID=134602 RepID=UPI003D907F33
MAWLTVIGPAVEQVDYRLQESAGCGLAHDHEPGGPGGPAGEPAVGDGQEHAQVDYRMEETNRLTWFGGGLADVGITAGTALQGEVDKARARALMDGVHPGTGEQLVKPKRAAHPASKIVAAPLLDALDKTAADRGVPLAELGRTTWAAARLARLARMVERDGEAHRIPVRDAERLAAEITAPIRLEDLYEPGVLQVARAHRTESVRIGDRGFDLTIDIPKSPSVVWALADAGVAGQLQGAFRAAVMETLADIEAWCSYGMRGEHGGGKTASRIDTSGLLGWVMWHDVARPVHGQAPDPHLHAHAVIAHMVRGADGKWSTPGNGGREFHRHVEAAGALAQARFRAKTTALGYRWERRDGSRVWELAGVPEQARELFSKRAAQTNGMLAKLGIDPATATTAQTKYASGKCREGKDTAPPLQTPGSTRPGPAEEPDRGSAEGPGQGPGAAPSQASPIDTRPDAALHTAWRAQVDAAHLDPDAIVAAARNGGGPDGPAGGPSPGGPNGPTPPPPHPPWGLRRRLPCPPSRRRGRSRRRSSRRRRD